MNGRYGNLDYSQAVKTGILLGVGLLALGVGGELVGHAVYGDLVGWANTLFTALEFTGVAVVMLAVFIFGIALPLTE